MASWLTDDEWESLMRAMVEGRYQLLLGAGASADANGPMGSPMTGWTLAAEMARDFGIPGDPEGKLQQVFSLARQRGNATTGENLTDYLRNRYWNCSAPAWYRDIVSIPWKYIWTLNIDDVVEHAYRTSFKDDAVQRLVSVNWTDAHRVPSAEQVTLVHLHGVAASSAPDNYIFDISSYLLAATERHRWHNIFADRYADTPTIILGARLSGEIDLETILEKGRLSADGPPSIIVLRTISEFDEARFRGWNLIPVQAGASEFMKEVRSRWASYAARVTATPEGSPQLISPNALAFLNQWERLEPYDDRTLDRHHDFYAGHEPEYTDIVHELDAFRDARTSLIDQMAHTSPQQLVVVSGPPFSGKSTTAMRLVRDCASAGWQTYRLDPERRPNIDAILWWARNFPRTVLFVDGVADFAPDFRVLVDRAIEASVPVHLVMVERSSRMKEVERELASLPSYTEVSIESTLSSNEVDRLIEKLARPGRLGVLVHEGSAERRRYFLADHGGELFSAMSGLSEGEGFVERVRRRYLQLASKTQRTAFHATAITSALGYGLPFGLCMATSGLTPKELDLALRDDPDFSEVVTVRRARLYPRHRVFGSYMLESAFSDEQNFEVTQSLALNLAPDLSVAAIRARTEIYRLARQLLDYQILGKWIGQSNLERWYSSLQEVFEWNARFWEQRALAASHDGRHAAAASWAEKAVGKHRDALALNTLAVVLFRKALEEKRAESDLIDGYLEAVAMLQEARAMARHDSEYPFVTFFQYTLEWSRRRSTAGLPLHPDIVRRWNDWWQSALNAEVFAGQRGQATLRDWQRKWLELSVSQAR
ncbi:P-loop NTPase [Paractinoplanes ferrugineus]|uniref:P-loop NTPase n=1 Tax=Paractinoplanes ferrugineus TaxID=113564 RepID=UPI0019453D1E|nr:SIR2 family protein [Actinoplanes ferrugineus]